MTHAGDARRSVPGGPPPIPGVMTFGAATAGEVLVDRYRLEQHVDTDTAGRQLWRGADMVLRRPVALVIRQPGGEAAAGMLTAAVAASRIVHPHLVSVYDAIDEGHRAYVVREWVPGVSLRDLLRQGPLDAGKATLVTHAVSEAVSALHAAGIVHGNVHPGTILVADDGRVVLLDAHADAPSDPEFDVRAVGAVLYACLTGYWPWAEAGRSSLPDAPRDGARRPVRPRQVRGGVPRHLDEIAAELLDPQVAPPHAGALAAEFAQLAATGIDEEYPAEEYGGGYDERRSAGPMGFREESGGGRRLSTVKIVAGIAILAIIAVVGVFVVTKLLPSSPEAGPSGPPQPPATTPAPDPTVLALTGSQVRLVDPPPGNRAEGRNIENAVDGDVTTGWRTDRYQGDPKFGLLKPGMGILIDLGAPTKVTAVRVVTATQGATMELRTGPADPGDTSAGDDEIAKNWTTLGPAVDNAGTTTIFTLPDCLQAVPVGSQCDEADQKVQFLVVWITLLPPDTPEGYRLTINEIEVLSVP